VATPGNRRLRRSVLVSASVFRLPLRPGAEPWLSKRQVAEHLGFSVRWVELRVREGMPHQRWGSNRLRFRVSDVETWLEERGNDR
jgi:predicted DNA-binding transcriptional regulator AlpA